MSLYGIPPTNYPNGLTHDQLIRDITAEVRLNNPTTTHPFMSQMITRLGTYSGVQMQTHITLHNPQQVVMKQIRDNEEAKPRTHTTTTRLALQTLAREYAISTDDLDKFVLAQGPKAAVEAAQYIIGSQGLMQTMLQKTMTALLGKHMEGTGINGTPVVKGYMHEYVNPATKERHYIDAKYDGTAVLGATKLGLTKEKIDKARRILNRANGILGMSDSPNDYVLLIPQAWEEELRKIPQFSETEYIGDKAGGMPYASGMFVNPYGIQVIPCDILPGTRGFNNDVFKYETPELGHGDLCQWIDLETSAKYSPASTIIPDDEQWAIMIKKSYVAANGTMSNIIGEHVGRAGGFAVKTHDDPFINRKFMDINRQTTFFMQNSLTRLREQQICIISLKKHPDDTAMFASSEWASA